MNCLSLIPGLIWGLLYIIWTYVHYLLRLGTPNGCVPLKQKHFELHLLGPRSLDPTVSFNPIGKHHLNEVTRVIDENKHLQLPPCLSHSELDSFLSNHAFSACVCINFVVNWWVKDKTLMNRTIRTKFHGKRPSPPWSCSLARVALQDEYPPELCPLYSAFDWNRPREALLFAFLATWLWKRTKKVSC